MIPLDSAVCGQIRYVLRSLDASNSDTLFQQLIHFDISTRIWSEDCVRNFVEEATDRLRFTSYGIEGCIMLLHTCFDHLCIYEKDYKNAKQEPLITSIFRYLLNKPNFSTALCESMKTAAINEELLQNMSSALQLSASEKIVVGLVLSESENNDIRTCGMNFCMGQIGELCSNKLSMDSTEQIQGVLLFLHRSGSLSKHVDPFMQMLSLVQLKAEDHFILAPFLSDEHREANFLRNFGVFDDGTEDDFDALLKEMDAEMSVANIMKELGYECTATVSQCREILSFLPPLTEVTVARILSTVARTHTGLGDNQNMMSTFCSALGCSNVSDVPSMASWNADVLIESIKQLVPDISWLHVIEKLDHEGFYFPNEASFSFFMSLYRRACQEPFPLHTVCRSAWKNVEGQLSFLKYAVSVPPEVFTFAHSARQLTYCEAVSGEKLQSGQANHAWLCLDLLELLCHLAERGHACTVRSMLEYPLKHCPELLLLGMANVNTTYNLLQNEVSLSIFPVMLKSPAASGIILHLWHMNPNLFIQRFVDAACVDLECISRILDTIQEPKIVQSMLDISPSAFSIRLVALASQRELIDLEKWLNSNISTYQDDFYEECLKFLKEVQFGTQEGAINCFHFSGALLDIYLATCPIFLKVLQSNQAVVASSHFPEELQRFKLSFMNSKSEQKNGSAVESSTSGLCTDDIESEANSYFHQMFSGQLTIDAIILLLFRLKESPEEREQLIFDCIIANLFEEYKFFSKYPERQLEIAANLFGILIKNQLITDLKLGIALTAVLDALHEPADSKIFVFGIKALEQFVDRLIEWPLYCNHILQIAHLRTTHAEPVTLIERALARISAAHSDTDVSSNGVVDRHLPTQLPLLAGQGLPNDSCSSQPSFQVSSSPVHVSQRLQIQLDDKNTGASQLDDKNTGASCFVKPALPSGTQPVVNTSSDMTNSQKSQSALAASTLNSSSPGFVRPTRAITSARFGSALNIETLVAAADRRETPIEAPASEIQDKISFIVNNLAAVNIDAKAKELTEILKEEHYFWFAQYMVMKRASIEPNFHDLYLKFIDKVDLKALNKEVIQTTYENCKVLLGSELIKSSSEERSLLKNLGSWLGKITIGRNQVLRAREIDPKSLIIEAFERGLMIAVIPFTSKILEACHSSLAYQPPNPWTMAILGLLSEIHAMPNLKMNLKFDIEVLFKNLGVDLKDVTPTSLLKDRVREVEGNPDFSNKDAGSSQSQIVSEVKSCIMPLNKVELPLEVSSPSLPGGQARILSQYGAPQHPLSGTLTEDGKLAALTLSHQLLSAQNQLQGQSQFSLNERTLQSTNIEQQVMVNPKLQALGMHLPFQSVLPIALDRAFKEIVSNIVNQSVTISTKTTKELVLKDYALETDDNNVSKAANLMVASLAGSLAHVTCKEQLRSAIASQLRNLLQGLNVTGEMFEQAIQLATNDNLDLGCALIERAATEKAIHAIDRDITHQLAMKRKQRDGVGSTYDRSLGTSHIGVPEVLRPKPGRLSQSQQKVYEDFIRLSWQNHSAPTVNSVPVGPFTSSSVISRAYASAPGQINSAMYSSGLINTGIGVVPQPLDPVFQNSEMGCTKLHGATTATGSFYGAGAGPHNFENDVVSSFPSVSAQLHPSEPCPSVKETSLGTQPFNTTFASERFGTNVSESFFNTSDALANYLIISEKLEKLVASDAKESEIQGVIAEIPMIIVRCRSRDEAATAVAQKVFKGLYEDTSNNAHVKAHLSMLAAIRDVSKLVVNELTSWVIYSEEKHTFNKDITVGLIRSELLNLAEYNLHMAKLLDAGRNEAATNFAISLIQTLLITASGVLFELPNLVDALAKVAARLGSTELLQQLVEIVKKPAASTSPFSSNSVRKEDSSRQSIDTKATYVAAVSRGFSGKPVSLKPDNVGFHDKVSLLFSEWYQLCELVGANDAAYAQFVLQLQQIGLLKGDDTSDRFFCHLMEISVSHCLSSEVIGSGPFQLHQTQPLSFLAIDIYAKLILAILKFFPVDLVPSKLSLLPKVLAVTVKFIQKDAEEKKTSFNPRPYSRLFVNWLLDLCSIDLDADGANFQVLSDMATSFHALQPRKVPGFSFAWLELVSHRSFMPKLLAENGQKGWHIFQLLLVDLFQFMEPFLRNAELDEPVHFLYKGMLRVLLVLLHDNPKFLCDYHFSFCDVIPPSCIQMRNIILSAFPRNMRLPDPYTPNLKIDLLDEISQSPHILSEVDVALKAKHLKNDLDEYLKIRPQGSQFLAELKQKLLLSASEAARVGTRYNVPLINSLVLYVGMQAIPHAQSMASGGGPLAASLVGAALDIFQTLIVELDTEGRHLFLNAIANQLRYPNNHTHYFKFILLYLFAESNQEVVQEQITRVLLERILVYKPHPWGLLVTFMDLIKNPRYDFWSRGFTRCAPEIERVFESVSRSCGGPRPVDEGDVFGGIPDALL